ncbi:DUF6508 domain-containing protein [Rhizobium sp. DKSPLA3]|uniref:DUF6508 domain-containing protein n=1 Tax=Rhizobium quercicola TaxID=2901226 RepID=A0A9X1NST1_9HYPH|nr:DUF6508 domain-containing protein [Rhizobium quercicola]MCD7110475.1 DUF6508 domain-containing protein [Rhizobium quercicola]PYE22321.1 hypothetical protein C8J32_11331 [Rhizobium sp. PP-CC-3A-592]
MQLPPNLKSLAPIANLFADPRLPFGFWAGGEIADGIGQVPCYILSPEAQIFVSAVDAGNWVRPEINWSGADERERYRRLYTAAGAIETATIDDLVHLLTTLIRGDRFNEGMLAKAFDDGVIHRILARSVTLSETNDS